METAWAAMCSARTERCGERRRQRRARARCRRELADGGIGEPAPSSALRHGRQQLLVLRRIGLATVVVHARRAARAICSAARRRSARRWARRPVGRGGARMARAAARSSMPGMCTSIRDQVEAAPAGGFQGLMTVLGRGDVAAGQVVQQGVAQLCWFHQVVVDQQHAGRAGGLGGPVGAAGAGRPGRAATSRRKLHPEPRTPRPARYCRRRSGRPSG